MTTESRLSEEALQNAFVTMNTLIQQNRRLMMFQELSFKWHIKHHNAMKEIINSLNRIIEYLGIDELRPIEIIEDESLMVPPPKFSEEIYRPFYGNVDDQPPPPPDPEDEDVNMNEKNDVPSFHENTNEKDSLFFGFSNGLNRFKTE